MATAWQTRCPVQRVTRHDDFPSGTADAVGDAVSATGGFTPKDTESDSAYEHFAWPKGTVYVWNPQLAAPFGVALPGFILLSRV